MTSLHILSTRTFMKAVAAATGALVVLALLCGAGRSAGAQDANAFLARAAERAAAQDTSGWAFTQTLHIGALAFDENERLTIVKRFDPSKPPGEREQVIEVRDSDGTIRTDDTADDLEDSDVTIDLPVYSKLDKLIENGVELVSETDSEATFRIMPDENGRIDFGDIGLGDGSLSERVVGELVVAKSGPSAPYVSSVKIYAPEKAGSMFAELNKLDIVYRFAPEADGPVLLRNFDLKLDMDILIFIDVDIGIESELSDYEFVGVYDRAGAL